MRWRLLLTTRLFHFAMIAVVAAILAGCSSAASLLNGGASPTPQAASIPVGNQLALPPDLSLAAPGRTVDTYQPNGPVASAAAPVQSTELYSGNGGSAPIKRKGGTLDEALAYYNISKIKPDGTEKTGAEINAELKLAIKAEKRRTNPKYGTIFNIGNIFSDE
jgi:hypothetical protein